MSADLQTRGVVLVHAAGVYDALEPAMMFFRQQALTDHTVAALAPADGQAILDVGCGTGILAAAVAQRLTHGNVVGIDASKPMIDIANRKRGSSICRFEHALAEALPFADHTFDGALSGMFFHHVDRELKTRCAAELWRVLRPGARLVVADLDTPWNLFGRLYGYGGYVLFHQPEIRENLVGIMPDIIREAGFADLETVYGTLGCIRVWTARKPT